MSRTIITHRDESSSPDYPALLRVEEEGGTVTVMLRAAARPFDCRGPLPGPTARLTMTRAEWEAIIARMVDA